MYDGEGRRSYQSPTYSSANVAYYLYDGDTPVLETDDVGNFLAFDLHGASGMESRTTSYDIGYEAYAYDPQGNTVAPVSVSVNGTQATLSVVELSAYDAYGLNVVENTQGAYDPADPVGFGGQYGYYHDYQGRYLLGHRYYDGFAGRFVTRDPIGYGGGLNLYGFVGNNPVNESDPSGDDPSKQSDSDQCGLPDDSDLGMRTAHPGMHAGTAQSNTARAMTRSLTATLVMAGVGIVTGGLGGEADEAASLSAKQRGLLGQLAHSSSEALMHKRFVSMSDLRSLTVHTGDEFAMFTRGSQRLVMRGSGGVIPPGMMNAERAAEMAKAGWRFSGHTHTAGFAPVGSVGDETILRAFGQARSGIWSTSGSIGRFYKDFMSRLTQR